MTGRELADGFERHFLSQPLPRLIDQCDRYELSPLFLTTFKNRQPVLEAGSGSGRWCAWLGRHGIRCHGIDWSHALCLRAAREAPGGLFVSGDMQTTPFRDASFGGILALGSVEHDPRGPGPALTEFRRILRTGGQAVVTVPHGGLLRRLRRYLEKPVRWAAENTHVRSIRGRPIHGPSLSEARQSTIRAWRPVFFYGDQGWYFHQYEFNMKQMRRFAEQAGLRVVRQWVGFLEEGILHNFGSLAGRWDEDRAEVVFTPLGNTLLKLFPPAWAGAMICLLLEKSEDPRGVGRP